MGKGIVYILTNEAMPGYIKIGKTADNLETRMRSLDTTGLPLPFTCHYAAEVENYDAVERLLHDAFNDNRIRKNREFFRLAPERAVAALKIANGRDLTPRDDVVNDKDDIAALNMTRERRSVFSFDMVGIKPGSTLVSAFDEKLTCTVLDHRYVDFEGERISLSNAALKIANRVGYKWSAIQGPRYWLYEGKSLDEMRIEFEEKDSE
jgi:hypothetical protein